MPFPVDNIRAACAKQNTTIAQIERELKIGNGVIARWERAKSSPPYDRLLAIAERLNTTVERLSMVQTDEKKPSVPEDEGLSAVQQEALNFIKALTDEQLRRFIAMGKAAFEKGE